MRWLRNRLGIDVLLVDFAVSKKISLSEERFRFLRCFVVGSKKRVTRFWVDKYPTM